jgi:hypothetical protein
MSNQMKFGAKMANLPSVGLGSTRRKDSARNPGPPPRMIRRESGKLEVHPAGRAVREWIVECTATGMKRHYKASLHCLIIALVAFVGSAYEQQPRMSESTKVRNCKYRT